MKGSARGAGSTTLVTEPSGWVQKVYPEPFGRIPAVREADGDLVPAAESATPYLFTDQEEDAEFGLQFFGARFYDPWIGRFLSPDPALLGPRPGASFADVAVEPQSLNAYAYALNRPTVRVDPTGAFIEEIVITGMRPAGPGFDPDSPPAFGPSDVFSPALGDLMATIGDGILLGIAIGLVLHSSMEDGDDKDDSTDAPESDSAEPAEQVEPFAETFETFEQAVGEVEEDSITDIEQVKTKDPGVIAQGFTQKWIGTTRNGDPVSAFFNPTTGQFAGGGPSSRIP